jgi:hypothetical protein
MVAGITNTAGYSKFNMKEAKGKGDTILWDMIKKSCNFGDRIFKDILKNLTKFSVMHVDYSLDGFISGKRMMSRKFS